MPHSHPEPGTIVSGKYRLERLLGQGGMGVVFAAENVDTGKRVAIKWMHAELAENPDAAQRFKREAQASARVQHPNVVDVYDVLSEQGAMFMVMQLLNGESLSDLMLRGTATLPELISLLLSAMRGVAAAHRQGIVHRDIKPDNIFLAREGDDSRPVPKVLDFGISKLSGLTDAAITKTGMALGTPLYMSVEQLSGAKDIDHRTDIYAFGVILYQAVTGRMPFEADSFAVLVAKIMTEQAPSPKELSPEVPLTLSTLIERAMAKDRAQRVGSLEELIRALEPFSSEAGFRGQMTIASADIPRVNTPNERPSAREPAIDRTDALPSNAPSSHAAIHELDATQPVDADDTRYRVPQTGGVMPAAIAGAIAIGLATWWLMRAPPSAAVHTETLDVVAPSASATPITPRSIVPSSPATPTLSAEPAPTNTSNAIARRTASTSPDVALMADEPTTNTPRQRLARTAERVASADADDPTPTVNKAPATSTHVADADGTPGVTTAPSSPPAASATPTAAIPANAATPALAQPPALSREAVATAMGPNLRALNACARGIRGSVVITFTIQGLTGRVKPGSVGVAFDKRFTSQLIATASLSVQRLIAYHAACASDVVSAVAFPTFEGDEFKVHYAFAFRN